MIIVWDDSYYVSPLPHKKRQFIKWLGDCMIAPFICLNQVPDVNMIFFPMHDFGGKACAPLISKNLEFILHECNVWESSYIFSYDSETSILLLLPFLW